MEWIYSVYNPSSHDFLKSQNLGAKIGQNGAQFVQNHVLISSL